MIYRNVSLRGGRVGCPLRIAGHLGLPDYWGIDSVRIVLAAIVVALGVTMSLPAAAQERGNMAEAKAMAERAAAHLIAVGPEKAIADFEQPDGGYRDRDLFVVVYNPKHIVAC